MVQRKRTLAIPHLEIPLSHILVCAVPNPGHVGPMLAAAQHLQSIGHNVTFHTAETFGSKVPSVGVRFVAMRGKANYDYRRVNNLKGYKDLVGADQKICLLKAWFAETIPHQHESIQQILRETPTDLVLVDTMLTGAFPMLLGAETEAATHHWLRSEPNDSKQSRLRDHFASGG